MWLEDLNRIYLYGDHRFGTFDSLFAIDCPRRQVVGRTRLHTDMLAYWHYNWRNQKLYISEDPSHAFPKLVVVKCGQDTLLSECRAGRIAWDPDSNRTYVGYDMRVVVYRDDSTGVKESAGAGHMELPERTVLHAAELGRADCRVLDITGRDVTDRRGRLAPGVYFLRDEGGGMRAELKRTTVRKVVVQ